MTLFGVDCSSFQPNLNMAQVAQQGFSFVIVKSSEGNFYTNPYFLGAISAARSSGLVACAYHYQRGTDDLGEFNQIKKSVQPGETVVLDVEAGGDVATAKRLYSRLISGGYRSPFIYIPRWWWASVGSPSLVGLPALWTSAYPDNNGGSASDIYYNRAGGDGSSRWQGYGGIGTVLLSQFTSTATVANYSAVDCNAFKGSIQDLQALFSGGVSDPSLYRRKFTVIHG